MTVLLYSKHLEIQGIKDSFIEANPEIYNRLEWDCTERNYILHFPTYRDVYLLATYAENII